MTKLTKKGIKNQTKKSTVEPRNYDANIFVF